MCSQVNVADLDELLKRIPAPTLATPTTVAPAAQPTQTGPVQSQPTQTSHTPVPSINAPSVNGWQTFVQELEQSGSDPMLLSIFKQANMLKIEGGVATIELANGSPGRNASRFLKEKISETENFWRPVLEKNVPGFGSFAFQEPTANPDGARTCSAVERQGCKAAPFHSKVQSGQAPPPSSIPKTNPINPDAEKWPKANLLTKHFAGKVESHKLPREKK